MTQIFISYSRNDRFIAETIRDVLEADFKTWIDLEGIPGGELWEQEILKAISASHAMVVLVTRSSADSQWVAREITLAREKKLQVFPLIMQKFHKLEPELQKLGVDDLQVIDFANQNKEIAYQQLKKALHNFTRAWAELNPLIEDLLSAPHYVHRASAAEKLGETGDSRAIDALITALFNDTDYMVRGTSAVALGKIGDERAVPKLLEAIDLGYATQSAIQALGEIGSSQSVDRLLNLLKSKDDGERYEAVEALGKIGDKRALPSLIETLNEFLRGNIRYKTDVPKALFQALRRLADKQSTEVILFALRSEQARIRQFAAISLSTLKNPDTIEPLIELLLNDDDMDVKGGIIGALGDIGDSRAVEPIIRYLGDDYLVLVSIEALGKIGDKRAINALEATYGKYRDLRIKPALDKALHQIRQNNKSP